MNRYAGGGHPSTLYRPPCIDHREAAYRMSAFSVRHTTPARAAGGSYPVESPTYSQDAIL
jgi:hypothetical protein